MNLQETIDVLWQTTQRWEAPAATLQKTLSFPDAYRAQLGVLARWQAAGEQLGGWKIGASAEGARKALGLDAPISGYLLASRHFASGQTLKLVGSGRLSGSGSISLAGTLESATSNTISAPISGAGSLSVTSGTLILMDREPRKLTPTTRLVLRQRRLLLEEHDLDQGPDQGLPVHRSGNRHLELPAALDGFGADGDLLGGVLRTRPGGQHLDVDSGGPGAPGVETPVDRGLDPVGRDREELGSESDDPVGADLLEFPDRIRHRTAGAPDEELSRAPPGHDGHLEGKSRSRTRTPQRHEEHPQDGEEPGGTWIGTQAHRWVVQPVAGSGDGNITWSPTWSTP